MLPGIILYFMCRLFLFDIILKLKYRSIFWCWLASIGNLPRDGKFVVVFMEPIWIFVLHVIIVSFLICLLDSSFTVLSRFTFHRFFYNFHDITASRSLSVQNFNGSHTHFIMNWQLRRLKKKKNIVIVFIVVISFVKKNVDGTVFAITESGGTKNM